MMGKWHEQNKERVAAYRKQYRAQNKEKLLSYSKEYYQDNKDEMKQSFKERYTKNAEAAKLKAKERRSTAEWKEERRSEQRKLKLKMIEYKGSVCLRCGVKGHPSIYDFHHTDPSTKNKKLKLSTCSNWERIRIELDKCIMLCANCHRIEHNQY